MGGRTYMGGRTQNEILPAAAGFALLAAIALAVFALMPTPAFASGTITVKNSKGTVIQSTKVSDGNEIEEALASALAVGKSAEAYEQTFVKVPAGNYTIGASERILIFSNTRLEFDQDTVLTTGGSDPEGAFLDGFSMFQAGHYSNGTTICSGETCTHGGYSQFNNIQVSGGIWDAGCDKHPNWNISGIAFRHGQDISFANMTFRHFTNHALDISGTRNARVTSCTFENSVEFLGLSERFWGSGTLTWQERLDRLRSTESVYSGFCSNEEGDGAYPLDSTPCENVFVSECTFKETYSGVGTHYKCMASKMQNLNVDSCQFTLKDGSAVNVSSCTSAYVDSCKLTGGYALARCDDATATVSENTAVNCAGSAIEATGASDVTVESNKITSPATAAVLLSGSSRGSIVDNKITCATGGTGIRLSKSRGTIESNTISGGATGIALNSPTGPCTVSANKVKNVQGNGIYLYKAKTGKTTVSGNKVPSASEAGIRVAQSKNITISGNTATGAKFCISVSTSSNLKISKNKASGGDTVIRIVDKCKKVTVSGNTLKKKSGKLCKGNAIYFYNACTGTVSKNKIVRPGTAGIRAKGRCKIKTAGNSISSPGTKAISIAA